MHPINISFNAYSSPYNIVNICGNSLIFVQPLNVLKKVYFGAFSTAIFKFSIDFKFVQFKNMFAKAYSPYICLSFDNKNNMFPDKLNCAVEPENVLYDVALFAYDSFVPFISNESPAETCILVPAVLDEIVVHSPSFNLY